MVVRGTIRTPFIPTILVRRHKIYVLVADANVTEGTFFHSTSTATTVCCAFPSVLALDPLEQQLLEGGVICSTRSNTFGGANEVP